MVPVGRALAGSFVWLAVLLSGLTAVPGLHGVSWAVGLGCGALVTTAVASGLAHAHDDHLSPADLVTLARLTLACAVAALVVEAWLGSAVTGPLVTIATVALLLDAVDGRVARATGLSTAFGARFDGEADAFLLLVLSLHVAAIQGAWVLVIGLARYVFWAAGSVWPWLRRRLPRRDWRKVVTAVQGIALVVAAADVVPPAVVGAALAAALALLAESFGRDVWWLARHRHEARQAGAAAT